MVSIKITWEGQGYRSRRQVVEQRFFVMTFPSLEGWLVAAAEGGRAVRDVMWKEGSGEEFWRYRLPQMERLFLSRLDMAASA